MITLYAYPSQVVMKVQIILEETGLEHNLVDGRTLEKDSPEYAAFRRASPTGQVPAIYDPDTDVALFETPAILIYLAEKTGKFLPGINHPLERAETLKWLMFEAGSLCPPMVDLYHYTLKAEAPNPEAEDRACTRALRAIKALEETLVQNKGRDFIAGEYSIADIALYPWMALLDDFAEITLGDYPALDAWAARMDARPSIKACQAY